MNSFAAIYFPESTVDNGISLALLTVFAQVFFYQPVEDDPDFVENVLFSEKLCDLRVPAPLAEGRDNFLRFIKDVNGHESEYYGGWLSHLSSGLGQDKDEASVWSLIAALQGGKAGETAQQERDANILGQARLVLKLSAILKRQDSEINLGMHAAAVHSQALLRSLKGDDGLSEAGLLPSAGGEPAPAQINIKHLLAAWGQMYLRDSAAANLVAATDSEQAAMEMFDVYEAKTGRQPVELCALDVPHFGEDDLVESLSAMQVFADRYAGDIKKIRVLLADSMAAADQEITGLADELALVSESYKENMNNKTGQVNDQIIFYLLPAVDLPTIVKGLSVAPLNSPSVSAPPNALVTVFKKKLSRASTIFATRSWVS